MAKVEVRKVCDTEEATRRRSTPRGSICPTTLVRSLPIDGAGGRRPAVRESIRRTRVAPCARCAMRAMQNHPVALDPHHLPLPLPVRRVPAGFSSPADDYLDGRPSAVKTARQRRPAVGFQVSRRIRVCGLDPMSDGPILGTGGTTAGRSGRSTTGGSPTGGRARSDGPPTGSPTTRPLSGGSICKVSAPRLRQACKLEYVSRARRP
jgi:hypothetical protein